MQLLIRRVKDRSQYAHHSCFTHHLFHCFSFLIKARYGKKHNEVLTLTFALFMCFASNPRLRMEKETAYRHARYACQSHDGSVMAADDYKCTYVKKREPIYELVLTFSQVEHRGSRPEARGLQRHTL